MKNQWLYFLYYCSFSSQLASLMIIASNVEIDQSGQKPIIKTVTAPSEIEGLEIPDEPVEYYDQFDWYKENSEYFSRALPFREN